jgi:proline dehydrogenase
MSTPYVNQVAARGAHLMVASHNQTSIERTVAGMAQRGLSPSSSGVYFGQLLGMSDNLSFTLGHAGYEVYKYVPYGPIQLVM